MFLLAIRQVFGEAKYLLLAITTGLVTFVLTAWLANLALVWQIVTSEWVPVADKATILITLIGSIGTNFTGLSAVCAILIAVLFGMNTAVVAYEIRTRRMRRLGHGGITAGLGGLGSGLFGIGCAACGSFILSPALTLLGASTVISLLPLGGAEFGVLGVGMLGLSLVLGVKRIYQPDTCKIHNSQNHADGNSLARTAWRKILS